MASTRRQGRPNQQSSEPDDSSQSRRVVHVIDWKSAARLAVAFGVMIAVLLSFQQIIRPLIILLAAISIAQALSPLVSRLERWLPRTLAVLLIYLAFLLFVGGLGAIVIPRLVDQAQGFVDAAPGFLEAIQDAVNRWDLTQDDLANIGLTVLERVGLVLVDLPFVIAGAAFDIFLVLAISLYWLLAAPSLMRFFLSLFPESRRENTASVLTEMGQTMGGYIRGQALVSLMVGVTAYVGLLVIGVQFALVLAIFAAVLEILPNIGPIIATVPMVAVAFFDSPQQALIVLIFWVVVQQLEAYVVTPNVLHRQADVPPLLVLLAIFAGGSVYGLVGAVVAIPVAGAFRVLVIRTIAPMVREAWEATQIRRAV
jgi:predicted PurR-regulated permease PerM